MKDFDPREAAANIYEVMDGIFSDADMRQAERIKAIKKVVQRSRWVTGSGLVEQLNLNGLTQGLPNRREWTVDDVYQAIQETRKYGKLTMALVSHPRMGFRFSDDEMSEEHEVSRGWVNQSLLTRLEILTSGQFDPLFETEGDRRRFHRQMDRIKEDIVELMNMN